MGLLNGTFGGGGEGTWSAHKMPLLGQFFENPDETAMKQYMREAAGMYHEQRPLAAEAQMRGAQNSMSAWNPVNNAIGQMYGGSSMQDLSQLTANPFPEGYFDTTDPAKWDAILEAAQGKKTGPGGALLTLGSGGLLDPTNWK